MTIKWNKLLDLINDNDKFLLSTHINPDGDGLGSEVAVYYYLKAMGKDCRIINISKLSDKYLFLNNHEK